jgi:hypothetical protein
VLLFVLVLVIVLVLRAPSFDRQGATAPEGAGVTSA